MRTCSIEGCERKHDAKGYCQKHYQKATKYGDPLGARTKTPLAERLWARVDKSGECWLWTGSMRGAEKSYGGISDNGRLRGVHRVSYELAFGPVPEGMVVDHKCHVRHCVRPEHLQVVSIKQNAENRRGPRKGSKVGVRGITQDPYGSYKATVVHNFQRHYLGSFTNLNDAEAAVIAKRNELYTNNLEDRRSAA